MPRNLYERCEVVYPVVTPGAAYRLRHEILEAYLRDDVKGRTLHADGSYRRSQSVAKDRLSAQEWFMRQSKQVPLRSYPLEPASPEAQKTPL